MHDQSLSGKENGLHYVALRVEDLVFVHGSLLLRSRNSSKYEEEETKLCDITEDDFFIK